MIPLDSIIRNATVIFIVGCATFLLIIVFCLLAMVASLTFDCWWHLSEFIGYCVNIDDDTENLIEAAMSSPKEKRRRRRPWILRLEKNGKIVNDTKTYVV